MLGIGVQTKNVVEDADPTSGFALLKEVGFTNADFSLNNYLLNTDLYRDTLNKFFDKSKAELEQYFEPHKRGAKENGININQMHMPYPIFIPTGKKFVNDYLVNHVMPKSMHICDFFEENDLYYVKVLPQGCCEVRQLFFFQVLKYMIVKSLTYQQPLFEFSHCLLCLYQISVPLCCVPCPTDDLVRF